VWPGETFAADGCTHVPPDALPSARALRGENTDRVEVCVRLPARVEPLWLSITGRPLRDEAGTVTGGVVTFNDITELRAARERVAELALTDELTGLPNRRAFRGLLARLVAEGQRGRNFALVMIDIDRFKAINDAHGHPTGDAVLVAVARRLNQRVRRTDFVGRYGGEEFCILYVDVDAACAERLAEELRACIAALRVPLSITASFGVCSSVAKFRPDEDALIAHADAALYEAKRAGRDCVRSHQPSFSSDNRS
jgi:diguanylate cyclase (GGDEF)-like protein